MPDAAPTAAKQSLGGRIVAAGETTREKMSWLLGLDAAADSYGVAGVAWHEHSVVVSIDAGVGEPVVACIERRTPESRGLVLTRFISVYFRDRIVPAGLADVVRQHGKARLRSWNMDRLQALVAEDPDLGRPGLPMPPGQEDRERPRSLLDTWGAPDSYADFFGGGELARSQLDSIDPGNLFHFVQHCDDECLNVNPHAIARTVSLVNYPWDDRVREPSQPPVTPYSRMREESRLQEEDEGMVTTDLNEDDVIFGNPKKLKHVLEYVAGRPSPDNKLIFFSNTCVPAVVGEDVESVVKQTETRTGRRILYLTVSPRSMVNVFQDLFVDRRLEAETNAPAAPHGVVNLLGFAGRRSVPELQAMLSEAGIGVNVRLLPDIGPELVAALPRAGVNVLYPNQTWQHHYDQLAVGSRIAQVAPAAPFGFASSRRWLGAVAKAAQLELDLDAFWTRYVEPWWEQWEALRDQAKSHRLGFVVRDEESFFLTTPGRTWGVPLLALAEEMGFGVDVLVRVSKPNIARRAAKQIGDMFAERQRHSVRAFESFAHLRQRLKESEADAFLSYHFFDWRLTEAGKGAFSVQYLETGVPGAIRSLERLLRVCKTPFYKRYGRHLARTAEGLRHPTGDRS